MWRTARCQSGVYGTLITTVVACLFLLVVSPSFAAPARGAHLRMKAMAPKAARPAVRQVAVGVLKPDHETMIRLENGQRTLGKQTADFNAAIQRQMSQLSSAIEDSRRETQQMLRQTGMRIDSTQRLLTIVVALLVLLCGGLLYIGRQLPSLPDKGLVWKADVSDVPEPGSDKEAIVRWRKGPNEGLKAGS